MLQYGRLYYWHAVNDSRALCPNSGWHVPSDSAWISLELALGMDESEANSDGFRGDVGGLLDTPRNGWWLGGPGGIPHMGGLQCNPVSLGFGRWPQEWDNGSLERLNQSWGLRLLVDVIPFSQRMKYAWTRRALWGLLTCTSCGSAKGIGQIAASGCSVRCLKDTE